MSAGTRALWLTAAVVLVSALLAYLLRDGGIFTTASTTGILGKFVYDGARDVASTKATTQRDEEG